MKHSRALKLGVVVVLAMVLLTGCIFGGKEQTPVLTSIQITPGDVKLEFGETQEFTVNAYDQNGKKMEELEELANATWVVDEAVGSLKENKGATVVFTAIDAVAKGDLVVTVGERTTKVNISILEEVIDPLIWSESFEDGEVGAFPEGWTISNEEEHTLQQTGPRVATGVTGTPDGEKLMKYTTKVDGKKAELFINIPEVSNGRLDFSIYQPNNEGSNFGVKPHYEDEDGDKQLFNFWISGGGDLRLPGKDAEKLGTGAWLDFRFEWTEKDSKIFVFQKINGNWVSKGEFPLDRVPNKILVDGGVDKERSAAGAVDNFKLWDLDLLEQ